MIEQQRAERMVELAREIKQVADTPREAFSPEHAAAQNSLASMGAELADLVLGAPMGAAR